MALLEVADAECGEGVGGSFIFGWGGVGCNFGKGRWLVVLTSFSPHISPYLCIYPPSPIQLSLLHPARHARSFTLMFPLLQSHSLHNPPPLYSSPSDRAIAPLAGG